MTFNQDISTIARKFSHHELETLHFFMRLNALDYVLIGGWAVYSYNTYLESIDIDIICSPTQVHRIREVIEGKCNWIPTDKQLEDDSWTKFAKSMPDYSNEFVYLDLLTSNFNNVFHEDRIKVLPYNICFEDGRYEYRNVNENRFKVPIKELLLIFKLKAYRDRSYDLLNTEDVKLKMHFEAKRMKDISDTLALIDPDYGPIDTYVIRDIIDEYQLHFIIETIKTIQAESEAIRQYRNKAWPDIRPWIERIITDLNFYD